MRRRKLHRYRLIETFLVETLGYTWDQVHDEAEVLEHAVSDFMIERIDTVLGHPSRDPHGDPIPDASGRISFPHTVPLSQCEPGETVVLERINDSDPKLLRWLVRAGAQRVGAGLRGGKVQRAAVDGAAADDAFNAFALHSAELFDVAH